MEIAHGATTFEDHCRAIESFTLAIAIRPTQARFFLARGNAFRAIGELERAAKDYGSAITLDDRSALYFANRGACYRKLNQTAKALEDLTNAIELDGRKAPHYFNRALVLHDAGFYREAIVDFSKALEDGSTASAANAAANNAGGSGATATPPANGGGLEFESSTERCKLERTAIGGSGTCPSASRTCKPRLSWTHEMLRRLALLHSLTSSVATLKDRRTGSHGPLSSTRETPATSAIEGCVTIVKAKPLQRSSASSRM